MLKLNIKGNELFDDENQEFITTEDVVLVLEHSLVSLTRWESKWEQPFLTDTEKTQEQVLDYIRCMAVGDDFPLDVFSRLNGDNFEAIREYIDAKMSATWFSELGPKTRSTETITNELIYYWMFSLDIPIECENWHLNRLFTLIRVFNAKNEKPKPVDKAAAAEQRRQLNEQRKAQWGTNG